MKKVLTRQELYDLVWSVPIKTLSEQLEVTKTKIISACNERKIPIPDSDYWDLKARGEEVNLVELSVDDSYWVNVPAYFTPTSELTFSKVHRVRDEIDIACKDILTVPGRLRLDNHFIRKAKESLLIKKRDYRTRAEGYISTDCEIKISVTPDNVHRSLLIVEALFRLLEARNHAIEKENNHICIVVDGEKHDFSLREKQDRIINPAKKNEFLYKSSGKLVISVGEYSRKREFVDGSHPLEEQLSQIVAYLEVITQEWKFQKCENEARQKIREEEERKALEAKKRIDEEKARVQDLFHKADLWHRSRVVKDYIAEIELRLTEVEMPSVDIQKWIGWAKQQAEIMDPIDGFLKENFSGTD